MSNIWFDDSLSVLVQAVGDVLGPEAVTNGLVLRDTSGKLCFFSDVDLTLDEVERVAARLQNDLGAYVRTDRAVACISDFGVRAIFDEPCLLVKVGDAYIRLVDRRLVGADWLRAPSKLASPPPRFVFASLKGGVGRTTALAVVAADLAARGKRVLAIDLDLEAPGLGAVLLDSGTTPEFGLIDALVENKLGQLDDRFMADMVGPSALADRSGKIDVIPAFGQRSILNPGDVLSKIARAYSETLREDGSVATTLDQVRTIVDYFADPHRYDVILVDARAGLHETTASAILGLGAHVFLFGLNEPQTFQGYAALLSHLGRVKPNDTPSSEWLNWITMVQGKAQVESDARMDFNENCRRLFVEVGLAPKAEIASASVPLPAAPFHDVPWDDDVPDDEVKTDDEKKSIDTTYVLDDERFRLFDPNTHRDLLSLTIYTQAYQALLGRINAVLASSVGGVN